MLTKREIEILSLIAKGHSSKEIAKKLFIAERTVDTHRTNIRQKTGCKNAAALTLYAVKNGFILMPDDFAKSSDVSNPDR